MLFNLSIESTWYSKASHLIIKNQKKKHMCMNEVLRKLCNIVVEIGEKRIDTINWQYQNTFFLIANKPIFKEIKCKTTLKTFNLFIREWIVTINCIKNLKDLILHIDILIYILLNWIVYCQFNTGWPVNVFFL